MIRYAYGSEDKEARRDDILSAGLALFLEDTRRLPSVAAIAERADLAKGTVYLYFTSKEEIFAALLSKEWNAFLEVIEACFTGPPGRDEKAVADFIDRCVGFLASHPYFMQLDSLGYGQLDTSLPPREFWKFKDAFSPALFKTGQCIDHALSLDAGTGFLLLVRSYALVKGLFQSLDFPEHIRSDSRFESHPLAGLDFTTELHTALTEYWRGALAARGHNTFSRG